MNEREWMSSKDGFVDHFLGIKGHFPCGCNRCGQGETPGWIKLRSPHVRGCWALDLLRGKAGRGDSSTPLPRKTGARRVKK